MKILATGMDRGKMVWAAESIISHRIISHGKDWIRDSISLTSISIRISGVLGIGRQRAKTLNLL